MQNLFVDLTYLEWTLFCVLQFAAWQACVLPGLGLTWRTRSRRCQRVCADVWSRWERSVTSSLSPTPSFAAQCTLFRVIHNHAWNCEYTQIIGEAFFQILHTCINILLCVCERLRRCSGLHQRRVQRAEEQRGTTGTWRETMKLLLFKQKNNYWICFKTATVHLGLPWATLLLSGLTLVWFQLVFWVWNDSWPYKVLICPKSSQIQLEWNPALLGNRVTSHLSLQRLTCRLTRSRISVKHCTYFIKPNRTCLF